MNTINRKRLFEGTATEAKYLLMSNFPVEVSREERVLR